MMLVAAREAKCFLTEEAALAIEEAVEVARRRSHTKTTALHVISALLASPASMLREACVRTRRSASSARLQFRALELCVGVSLDLLPSSKSEEMEEPPVSNSLMAAIKRAQAAQERNQSPSVVKVELKFFTLSILEDPVVSKVFHEAGFRSLDIKLWIVSPEVCTIAQRLPPILLSERRRMVDSFNKEDVDENSKIIGELLVRKKQEQTRRNPLLLGVCSITAMAGFVDILHKKRPGIVPEELSGLKVVSLVFPIFKYTILGGSEEQLASKFNEAESVVEQYCYTEPGVLVNIGELRAFMDVKVSVEATNFVVSNLSRLFEIKRRNLWLLGTCLYFDTFFKFQDMFPTLEHDWDLHLLPVSSKSSSMKSFVPLPGFFSWSLDSSDSSNSNNQQRLKTCHLCTDKYEQELKALLKEQPSTSAAGENQENLPSWLRLSEHDTAKTDEAATKKKVDETIPLVSASIAKLQKKWLDICKFRHQQHQPFMKVPDVKDFESLKRVFARKVSWQDDAICSISEAVSRCKNGYGRCRGSKSEGGIWLAFTGPDKVGKKMCASVLAQTISGCKENLISVDFSSRDRLCHSNSIFGRQDSNDHSLKFRGKDDAGYVAWELSKKPRSVVFFENVDEADNLLQSNLVEAIRTVSEKEKPIKFSEEIVLDARSWEMQVLVSPGSKEISNMRKRKLIQINDSVTDSCRQGHKSLRRCLDLNLPAGEADVDMNLNSGDCNTDFQHKTAAWLEDLLDQVDERVDFKPFDFDSVAKKVMKEIELQFRRTFESGVLLEIDHEVMVQILAAAWISGKYEVIEDWVEKVLNRSFADVQEKYHPAAHSVVKLTVCHQPLVNEFAPGLCLPAKVNI